MVDRTCTADGCDRKLLARGFCNGHWRRWRNGKPLDGPIQSKRPRGMTPAEAFRHVLPEEPPAEGCWLWRGRLDKHGYGRVMFIHRTYFAHRISHELFIGPIPAGLGVCHRCDNPPCCNPSHLYAGTQADNVGDMITRGRSGFNRPRPQCQGESHHGSVLTNDDAADIRRRYAQGGVTQGELAALYGVSPGTIHNVIHRRHY